MQNKKQVTAGLEAIDEVLKGIYKEQEPKYYGTAKSYRLGGKDPLDGISIYYSTDGYPHWHYVTYGFSELYEKISSNKEYSGWGFELTFRLKKECDENEAPTWPIGLLQNLGRYVFNSGNAFAEGDYLNTNAPILIGSNTELKSLLFGEDKVLGKINTPNGKVQFLQVIGATLGELGAAQCWSSKDIINILNNNTELGITDLNRKSITDDEIINEKIENGILKDGSNTGVLFFNNISWKLQDEYNITISVKDVNVISKILCGRILRNRELILLGNENKIKFVPYETFNIDIKENILLIYSNEEFIKEFREKVKPVDGSYRLSNLIVNVKSM